MPKPLRRSDWHRLGLVLSVGILLGMVAAPNRVWAQAVQRTRHASIVLAPLGAGLGFLGGTIDHDAGGYRDSFKFQPDKQAHLLASVVLAKAVADGTSVKLGFATCLLAGAAWEMGQRRHHGFASGFDLSYDGLGCAAGALWGRK